MARLIDADALKQEIRKGTRYFVRVWDTTGREKWELEKDLSLKEIDEIIDNAPTIDAEPIRHGKWLMNDAYGTYCSECGSASFEITGRQYSKMKTRYCWQCGAKMDDDEISNIAKESADKISKALEKVRAKGMQTQNIKEDDEP